MAGSGLHVEVLSKELVKVIGTLPSTILKQMHPALRRVGADFTLRMKKERMSAGKAGPFRATVGRQRVAHRTGNLKKSLGYKVLGTAKLGDIRLRVFVGNALTPYAKIQETGGVISGRPWLTIPLPANITPGGKARFPSAAALKNDSELRSGVGVSKAGNLIIWISKRGGGAVPGTGGKRSIPAFILKRSVKLTPRLGFLRTWRSKHMRTLRKKTFDAAIARAVNEAKSAGK